MPEKLRHIDLSHIIEDGMVTYKNFPAPIVCDWLSRVDSRSRYESGTEFQIGKIEMVANTGTYIDSPFHRYADGIDISELALENLAAVECVVIRIDDDVTSIGPDCFNELDFRGKAVLVNTRWDRHWRTDPYFENHPHLVEASARRLIEGGAILVGIDSYNIDSVANPSRPVHTLLLGSGVPIIEHMCNLDQVPDTGALLTAAPVAVRGMGSFPVRALTACARNM
jgi:kynurenine formamidase